MRTRAAFAVAALIVMAFAAAPAHSVSGAAFTTINSTADGFGVGKDEGLCHNGNGDVNCNQYFNKRFVWLNGGPTGNALTDGTYFFAILAPGMQHDPNDQVPVKTSDKNLSDDFDTYQNRTFTVKNGNIDSYTGALGQTPHSFGIDTTDDNEMKIRAFPYSDTPNNGGVYILAICSLAPNKNGKSYPVKSQSCKYDAFKMDEDEKPPSCPRPTFGVNAAGQKTATQLFSDAGGIDTINIVSYPNVAIAPLKPGVNWFQGTTSQIELIATKIDQNTPASVEITVRDVAGNESRCDPLLTTVRAGRSQTRRISGADDFVSIRNGRPGLRAVVVTVNGRRYAVRRLAPGQTARLSIKRALRPGKHNVVRLRGIGRHGAGASLMISN
jgi:hypothetical protein